MRLTGLLKSGRCFSGIQPTGRLHLGNYLGAVRQWANAIRASDSCPDQHIFSVVDLHAVTLPQEPASLLNNLFRMTASLLACGVDHERCILFQQSSVAQHSELCWILSCFFNVAALSRLSQYKEKSSNLDHVPLGLFLYPVLQSADILLYKASQVPVGEDNLQNVETCRKIAKSFNARCGPVFPIPSPRLPDPTAARVKSLRDPSKKMSKSDPDTKSCLYIDDSPDEIVRKVKKAVTDMSSKVTFDPVLRPGVANLVTIHSELCNMSPEEVCRQVQHLDTGAYKILLADIISQHFRPIREEMQYLDQNRDHLERILKQGADKARHIAELTMQEVRQKLGFVRAI